MLSAWLQGRLAGYNSRKKIKIGRRHRPASSAAATSEGAQAMQTHHASAASDIKAAALAWRPLSSALGAEILGVDLRRANDDRVFAQIKQIWHQTLVILLRNQQLSEDAEVRFAEK